MININRKINGLIITPMVRYMIYSITVTIIDTAIVWMLFGIFNMDIVSANTIGVVAGFIIHYLLASKSVFQTEFGAAGFTIYLGTFFIGLVLADWLIYVSKNFLFSAFPENLSFLLSKGISIVIPFFFLYYLRKLLFDLLKSSFLEKKHIN